MNIRRPVSSLRARLVSLVALAVMPAIGLTVYTGLAERRAALERGQDDAFRLARLIAADIDRLLEGGRQLVATLAALPEIRGRQPAACSALLSNLLVQNQRYANFGAANTDGDVFCSAIVTGAAVNIGDRSYFRTALAERRFAIGEFQIGRITGRPTVNFGLPFTTPSGQPGGVVFAALSLDWLNALPLEAELPEGSALAVFDRNGTILVRQPQPERWVGKRLPEAELVRVILSEREGREEVRGLDGVRRLYAFTELAGVGNASVTVGIPRDVVAAPGDRLITRNLIGLSVIGVLALAVAWWAGNRFVAMPVQSAMARERDTAESLRVADAVKNTFLAAVSHDLRNPVAVIRGFTELLERDPASFTQEETNDILRRIATNARKLERLTNDLMDLDRLSRGLVEPKREPTDITAVARRVVGEVDPRGHELVVHGDAVVANVDGGQVERIVENLVRNAVKYTKPELPIDVRVARASDGVMVCVEDRGPGVPDDIKDRVFQAFERRAGETGSGMGVGLHLVRRFAELHGGRAWVEDRDGGGARFVVLLGER